MSDQTSCPVCNDTNEVLLPTRGSDTDFTLDEYPCPICRPWRNGFPGVRVKDHYVIAPSDPGEPAVFNGWPKRQEL